VRSDPLVEAIEAELADLPGEVKVQVASGHADYWTGSPLSTVVLAEHRLSPVTKYAGWIRVSNEMLDDAPAIRQVVAGAFDRHLRPWRYPDRNPWPTITPLPWLARLAAWIKARRAGWDAE
jgi:hypothetical protein